LPKVIGEIYRVTKPGGIFFFDTLNRTFLSKLVAIKIWQEWKSTAFMPPRLHVWKMFIRPEELKELLVQSGFARSRKHAELASGVLCTLAVDVYWLGPVV